jgi:hypothetical protein
MTDDLVKRLRTACSPVSPLGILCSEAADALVAAEQRERELVKHLERAIEALEPMSDAVFNDNGDITTNIPTIRADDCEQAYFVSHAASRFIEAHTGGEDANHG